MSATHTPEQPDTNGSDSGRAGASTTSQSSCGCPDSTTSDSGSNGEHAPALSAEINADLSGVQANADVLGHDVADISINLGLIDDALGLVDSGVGTGLGLVDVGLGVVDVGLGVVDDVLCGIG
jgi:hypothetical protein